MNIDIPQITVITVCYNAASILETTILSVINQSYPNLEYIVIDGGSFDSTVDIIKKYKDNIDYWISEADGGVYFGMNKGIAQSHGDWICFINAGDRFVDNTVLEKIFNSHIDFENIGVIVGDVVLEYLPFGRVLRCFEGYKGEEQSINLCHQSSLTKGNLLRGMFYDTSFKIFADINAFHELWKQGVRFEYIPVAIAIFEGFDGISSSKPWVSFKESNKITECRFYNSISWWVKLVKILAKELMKASMSEANFRKHKYLRIAKKFKPIN